VEPFWGVWKLPGHISRGVAGMALENELESCMETWRPSMLGYEAPLPPNLQTNAESARILIGLAMAAEISAARFEIPVISRSSQVYRTAVIGRSHLTDEEKAARPRMTVKSAIVAPWIRAHGWQITEHDAADAVVGLCYELGIRHSGFRKKKAA